MTVFKASEALNECTDLVHCIEEELKKDGMDIRIKIAIGPGEKLRSQLENKELDVIRIVDSTYIRAYDENPKIQLLAKETNKDKGRYARVLFTHDKTGIRTLEDIKKSKKSIIFASPGSTSYLAGSVYFLKHGMKAKDFKAVNFSHVGRADAILASVAVGENDLGVTARNSLKEYGKKNLVEVAEVDGPSAYLWVARQGLDAKIVAKLRKILLNLKDKKCLAGINRDGFLPAQDSDLNPLREQVELSDQFDRQ